MGSSFLGMNPIYLKTFYVLGVCHRQQCAGYRHYSTSFKDSLRVSDIKECSDHCAAVSYCNTFSFKRFVTSDLGDNCLLSSFLSFRLDTTRDLTANTNWNLYRRLSNSECANNENDRQDNYDRGISSIIQTKHNTIKNSLS